MSAPLPSASAAVCHRCGGRKRGPFVPCKTCGFVPQGDQRSVAWLFSTAWLDELELEEAARRVLGGGIPDPSRALRDQARQFMGAAPLGDDAKRPLSSRQVMLLFAGNVLFTPMMGFAVWFGLRRSRPIAARQALSVSVPVSLALTAMWAVVWLVQS